MNQAWTHRFHSLDNAITMLEQGSDAAWEVAYGLAKDGRNSLSANIDHTLDWVQDAKEQFATAMVHASNKNLNGFTTAIGRARAFMLA